MYWVTERQIVERGRDREEPEVIGLLWNWLTKRLSADRALEKNREERVCVCERERERESKREREIER